MEYRVLLMHMTAATTVYGYENELAISCTQRNAQQCLCVREQYM